MRNWQLSNNAEAAPYLSTTAPISFSCRETARSETTKTPPLLTPAVRPAPKRRIRLDKGGREHSDPMDSEPLTGVRPEWASSKPSRGAVPFGVGEILRDERRIGLRAGCYGAALCWDRFTNRAGPGEEIYFEDVVKPVLEDNLEASLQTGRWPDNVKDGSVRQENDPSLSSFMEMNRHERCFCAVRRRGLGCGLFGGRANHSRGRRCNRYCHERTCLSKVRCGLSKTTPLGPFFPSVCLSRVLYSSASSSAERARAAKTTSDRIVCGTNGNGMDAAGRALITNQGWCDPWRELHTAIGTWHKPPEDTLQACHEEVQ